MRRARRARDEPPNAHRAAPARRRFVGSRCSGGSAFASVLRRLEDPARRSRSPTNASASSSSRACSNAGGPRGVPGSMLVEGQPDDAPFWGMCVMTLKHPAGDAAESAARRRRLAAWRAAPVLASPQRHERSGRRGREPRVVAAIGIAGRRRRRLSRCAPRRLRGQTSSPGAITASITGFDFYRYMAENLLDGPARVEVLRRLGDKWANRAPLYPLFVAGVRYVADARRPFRNSRAAALGALACSCRGDRCAMGRERARRSSGVLAALWPYSVVTTPTRGARRLRAARGLCFSSPCAPPIVRRRRRTSSPARRRASRRSRAQVRVDGGVPLRGLRAEGAARPARSVAAGAVRRSWRLGDPQPRRHRGGSSDRRGPRAVGRPTRKRRSPYPAESDRLGRSESSEDLRGRLERAAREERRRDRPGGGFRRRVSDAIARAPSRPRGATGASPRRCGPR